MGCRLTGSSMSVELQLRMTMTRKSGSLSTWCVPSQGTLACTPSCGCMVAGPPASRCRRRGPGSGRWATLPRASRKRTWTRLFEMSSGALVSLRSERRADRHDAKDRLLPRHYSNLLSMQRGTLVSRFEYAGGAVSRHDHPGMNEQAIELSLHPPVAMCTPPHPRMLRSIGFTRRIGEIRRRRWICQVQGWLAFLSQLLRIIWTTPPSLLQKRKTRG